MPRFFIFTTHLVSMLYVRGALTNAQGTADLLFDPDGRPHGGVLAAGTGHQSAVIQQFPVLVYDGRKIESG